MEDRLPPSSESLVRKCANIKSRKVPHMQCNINATHGDYCTRHWKHPNRFVQKTDRVYICSASRKELKAICVIQKMWRKLSPFIFIRQHGIGFYQKNKSVNETELFTLEPIDSISNLYYYSFVDSKKNLWSFDIRSLSKIISFGEVKKNPYTREPFSSNLMTSIRNRITWLRKRKYCVLYPIGVEFTQEQLWSQKVLDFFMKIESFGYYVSCEWFTDMSIQDHKKFYRTLYELWNYRLGLTNEDRLRIAPGSKPLFKYIPDELNNYRSHTLQWWATLNLALIEALLTRSVDKEQQKLGATYCVMGLVATTPIAAESFPWMAETLST
jgi:hypothetical protein